MANCRPKSGFGVGAVPLSAQVIDSRLPNENEASIRFGENGTIKAPPALFIMFEDEQFCVHLGSSKTVFLCAKLTCF